ncbi:MAG: glycosyltransferase family 9 protein [Acidobacteriota bacterium]
MKLYFAPSRALAAHRLEHGGPRIYDPRERWFLTVFDFLLRATAPLLGLRPAGPDRRHVSRVRRILALRLDRLGDLIATLPALAELRRLAPEAEIELAVGSWNEELARGLPFVDRLRRVNAPWAAWESQASVLAAVRALRTDPHPELAIDFQGDVRVILLMALSGARLRAGYGETGGSYLLTHQGQWNESWSLYRQNMELLKALYPDVSLPKSIPAFNFLLSEDRRRAQELLEKRGLARAPRPLIGIHPSAGRDVKQWEVAKFAALVDRLAEVGTVVLTGAASDRDLVDRVASRTESSPHRLVGQGGVRTFAAVVERLDVFITGDTGPMHVAHAVGTPNVAVFGPSDPGRFGPDPDGSLRSVVRKPVYCSPCNMIRKPPRECTIPEAPECLARISVEDVLEATLRRLAKGRKTASP